MLMPFPWAIELPPPVREVEGGPLRPVLRFPRDEYIKLVTRQAERMTELTRIVVHYRYTGGPLLAFNMSGGADTPGRVTLCLHSITTVGDFTFYAAPSQLISVGEHNLESALDAPLWRTLDGAIANQREFRVAINEPTTIGLAFGDDTTGSVANGCRADTFAQIILLAVEFIPPPP